MSALAKFFGRRGTRSSFPKKETGRSLPEPKDEPTDIQSVDEDQDKQDREKKDKEVEAAEGSDPKERAGEPSAKGKGKKVVKANIASDKPGTRTTTGTTAVFTNLWSNVLPLRLVPHTYSEKAEWIPNAIPLYIISEIAFSLVGRTNWIEKHEAGFNPYACFVAVCYLYYIQILRAREAAGALNGYETSTLTRFRKCFPEEKICIPAPFLPFFYSIVATEPEDLKYSWIVPTYGSLATFTGMAQMHTEPNNMSGANHARPLIPLLLAQLCEFGSISHTHLQGRVDRRGIFTVADIHNQNHVQIFGYDMDLQAATNIDANNAANVLRMGGLTVPFQFFNDNKDYAYDTLRESNFFGDRGVNFIVQRFDPAANPQIHTPAYGTVSDGYNRAGNAPVATHNFSEIDQFLLLSKDKNGHWADYLFEQLNIACRHFDGNATLNSIPVTGGMESSIFAVLKTPNQHANRYVFEDRRLGSTLGTHYDWYQGRAFKDLSASFWTGRADVEREEELQAFSLGINAKMPYHTAENLTTGRFFTQAINAGGQADATRISRLGIAETSAPGAHDMYQGWEALFVRGCFRTKPTNV